MLVVIAGLPGTGKTTVAEAVAVRRDAVHLSVDELENALLGAGLTPGWTTGVAAYEAVRAAAEQNLRLGRLVVVDAVNDGEEARDTWRRAARTTGSDVRFVVLLPPHPDEHRSRLADRRRDLQHVPEPSWEEVCARAAAYAPWTAETVTVDAAASLDRVVEQVLEVIDGAVGR